MARRGLTAISVTGKRVFIVGGGNSAGQAAVFYAGYAAEVIVLVRGAGLKQSMSQYLIEQIQDKANIRVEPYTQVISAHGEDHLEQITTLSRPPGHPESSRTREAKALVIMIGADANTQWLPASLERDADGYICTTFARGPTSASRSHLRPVSAGSFAQAMFVTALANASPAASARAAWR
jgi:thioredoxin reductase (NADPH)